MYHRNISIRPVPDSLIDGINRLELPLNYTLIITKDMFVKHLKSEPVTLLSAGTFVYRFNDGYDSIFTSSTCHAPIVYAEKGGISKVKEITTIYDGTLPAAEEYLSWVLSPNSPWKDLFETASITVFTSGNRISSINIKPNECYHPLLMNFLIALRAIKEFNSCIQSWNVMVKDYKIHPAYAFLLCRIINIKNNSWLYNGHINLISGLHWPLKFRIGDFGFDINRFKNGKINKELGVVCKDSHLWLSENTIPPNLSVDKFTTKVKTKFSSIGNVILHEEYLEYLEQQFKESIYV